jgi:hypothetical protein
MTKSGKIDLLRREKEKGKSEVILWFMKQMERFIFG